MADMTLDALMRQALAGQQQKRQSLSDRMAEIDKYAAQVAPNKKQQYGDAMSMNAPLANPLTLISNQLSDGDVASSTRRAYEADMDINQNELYKIMAMLQDQEQFNQELNTKSLEQANKDRDYELDVKKYELDAMKASEELNPTISSLKVGAKKTAADYKAYLDELKRVRGMFGEGNPGLLGSLVQGKTGALAQFKGSNFADGGLRDAVSALETKVRNKMFGSALTENEVKEAKKFLPSSGKQENANISRLDQQIIQKENELRTFLMTQGLSPDLVNEYVNQPFSQGGTSNQNNAVIMTAPNGEQYQVDASEVEEAKKNGWR